MIKNISNDLPLIWKARLALAGGVIALTLSPLFFRWAEAPPIVTSFYRMAITTIILSLLLFMTKDQHSPWKWKFLIFPILGGTASALDHSLWGTALNQTSVANATLLNNVSPLWVALIAWFFLKEKLGKSFWFGLVAVMLGATMVLGSTFMAKPEFLLGDILALVSSIFYAMFFLATSKGREVLPTIQYLFVMTLTAAVWLFLATKVLNYPLVGYPPKTNLTFFLAAIISQFGAYFLISYSLGRLSASVVTPTMVAQPVLTALLAIPITGETLIPIQGLGGLTTLFGVYLINISSNSQKQEYP